MVLLLQNSLSLTTGPKRKALFCMRWKISPKANKVTVLKRNSLCSCKCWDQTAKKFSILPFNLSPETPDSKCLHFRQGMETIYRNQQSRGSLLHRLAPFQLLHGHRHHSCFFLSQQQHMPDDTTQKLYPTSMLGIIV